MDLEIKMTFYFMAVFLLANQHRPNTWKVDLGFDCRLYYLELYGPGLMAVVYG